MIKLKHLLAFAAVLPCIASADDFTYPVQTSIAAAGSPQRFGVGAAVLNGNNYVYYASTDGYLSAAGDSGGNLIFSDFGRISTSQGNLRTSLNPAAASLNGILYVGFITNNQAYVVYSTDGVNFSAPVNIPVPGSPKIDGELTIAAGPNGLYFGLHNGTNNTLVLCSTTLSFNSSCFQTNQGSTYAPGVAFAADSQGRGTLYASAQSNNSAHTLLFSATSLPSGDQLSSAPSFASAGGSSDQTSMQPATLIYQNFDNPYYRTVTIGFRSNDASAQFLFKTVQYGSNGGPYWTQTHGASYSVAAPDLVGSTASQKTINFIVVNGKIAYSTTPAVPQ